MSGLVRVLSICLTALPVACASAQLSASSAGAVYVHDSPAAGEKLALAERLEHLKEWDKAADLYLSIINDYPDVVIPVGEAAEGNQRYTSVVVPVQDKLCSWPAEGIDAFRRRFESQAATMLSAAGRERGELQKVVTLYFLTDSARQAALQLIDLDLESGNAIEALTLAQRELTKFPNLSDNDRSALCFRAAIAAQRAGEHDEAQKQLKSLPVSVMGVVDGKPVALATKLADVLKEVPSTQAAMSDDWPLPFGNAASNRITAAGGFGGMRLATVDLPEPSLRGVARPQVPTLQAQMISDRQSGQCTDILPVVDGDELFFQDNAHLFAVNIETGDPLPGWLETYRGEPAGAYAAPNSWPTPRATPCSLALTADSVLAIMSQADSLAGQFINGLNQRESRLVCLDRRSGRERWTVQPHSLLESLRSIEFIGSPLIVGDVVYIQAHGGNHLQFDDAYTLAFNLADGSLKWTCYLASANVGNFDGDPSTLSGAAASFLAGDESQIYVQTNVGAVAAINAANGTVNWLNTYSHQTNSGQGFNLGFARRAGTQQTPRKAWEHNPAILSDNALFVMPDDSPSLMIFDARDGRLIKQINLEAYHRARALLGVVGARVVFNSEDTVYCVDWRKYDPQGDGPNDAVAWMTNPLKRPDAPSDSIRGRGMVTQDSVIIPTAWQVLRFSLNNGLLKQTYPTTPDNHWSDDEGPGNVLLMPDHLLICGPTAAGPMRMSVYTNLETATRRLDAAAAAAPNDIEPRLRYAQIMFAAGQYEVGQAKLDEAQKLLAASADNAALKSRLFDTLLVLARKAGKSKGADSPRIAALFDRAGQFASTPAEQVNLRVNRSVWYSQSSSWTDVIRVDQEILQNPQWRALIIADANGATTHAGEWARRDIESAVGKGGSYAPFEDAANKTLADAQKNQATDAMVDVAAVYPNSSVAGKALLAAAERYQWNGAQSLAARLLRRAYADFPKQIDQVKTLEWMAADYLATPNRASAAVGRLRQAARMAPTGKLAAALVLPDGQHIENLTYAAAADLVQRSLQPIPPQLPDVDFPSFPHESAKATAPVSPFADVNASPTIPNVQELIAARRGFERFDRIAVHRGSSIDVFKPGTANRLFSIPDFTTAGTSCAWVDASLLLMNGDQLLCVSAEDGRIAWRIHVADLTPPPVAAQVPSDGETPIAVAPVVPDQGQVFINGGRIVLRGGGRVILGRGGMALGNFNFGPQPAQPDDGSGPEHFVHLQPLSDRVIVDTSQGRLIAISLSEGKPLWQLDTGDTQPKRLLACEEFVVTQTTDDAHGQTIVASYDSEDGRLVKRAVAGNGELIDVALSPEGLLVMLTPSAPIVRDLFEPGGIEIPPAPPAGTEVAATFAMNPTNDDSLQLSGQYICALADNNTHFRVYSLPDGKPVPFDQQAYCDAGAAPGNYFVCGKQIYWFSGNAVYSQRIGTSERWQSTVGQVMQLAVSKTHLLCLSGIRPQRAARGQPGPTLINAFWRGEYKEGSESGKLDVQQKLSDAVAGTLTPVDGGVYYLNLQHQLRFLRGAGG